MQIEQRQTADLVPFLGNARTHSTEQVQQIADSIAEFGFVNPILIGDDDVIIAGHGRLAAAQLLALEEVPVIVISHLSPAQRRALVIADNRIAELAGWDEGALARELDAIRKLDADFDLEVTGFGEDQIDDLLAGLEEGLFGPGGLGQAGGSGGGTGGAGEPGGGEGADPHGFAQEPLRQAQEGEDEVPEPPVAVVSEEGDVWILGEHRLVCGSSTAAETVRKALGGHKPLLMVTDPPYGVNYDPEWRSRSGLSVGGRTGVVLNDDIASWGEAWALFPGEIAYVWHGGLQSTAVAQDLEAVGFVLRYQIIWAKPSLVIGRGDYHWQHEPCWMAVKKGGKSHWAADRKQTTLWQIARHTQGAQQEGVEDGRTNHSTQKPVECMRRPILHHTQPGEAVYEPFMGSGTTLIAAEATGRICLGVELNPVYVDVAVDRWQTFAGAEAIHEATGETFNARRAAAEAALAAPAPEPTPPPEATPKAAGGRKKKAA